MPKVDAPSSSGIQRAELSSQEQAKLERSLKRGFEDTRAEDTEPVVKKVLEYREEIRQAAEIAKAEFDSDFDGMAPESGSFGLDEINHGYFGWDSWGNIPDLTAGETTAWLDNSVPDNLGGAGGMDNPLTVGEDAVHLVLAVGSYAEAPKISRVRWRLNDQPRAAVSTEFNNQNTDLRMKWLDTPLVLKNDDDIFAEVYADEAGSDAPYLYGVTFLKAKPYRILDPADMAGVDQSNIVVE